MADALALFVAFITGEIVGAVVISLMTAAKNNDKEFDNPEERH